MFKEFKEFAIKGNFIDMAVGIVIGASFSTIVKSLVDDVIMPIVGVITGGVDFSNLFLIIAGAESGVNYSTLAAAQAAGVVTINYGLFINAVVTFLIVVAALFVVIKSINSAKRKQAAAPEEPTAPSAEVQLLTEIRDALKR